MDSKDNKLSSTTSSSKRVCINPKCESATPLTSEKVPQYVLTFYKIEEARHQRVCERCMDNAFDDFDKKRRDPKNKDLLFDLDVEIPPHRIKRNIIPEIGNRSLNWYTNLEMQTMLEGMDKHFKEFKAIVDLIVPPDEEVNAVASHDDIKQLYTSRVIPITNVNGIQPLQEDTSNPKVTKKSADGIMTVDTVKSKYMRIRQRINVGNAVHVMRRGCTFKWEKGTVLEAVNRVCRTEFGKFTVECDKTSNVVTVDGRGIAYPVEPSNWLPYVGYRVIGKTCRSFTDCSDSFYSGTVGETPNYENQSRYLVFFDYGQDEYVSHENIRLICEQSALPHEDVPIERKMFVEKYFKDYPNCFKIEPKVDDILLAKFGDSWVPTEVKAIDSSLIELRFSGFARTEMIYCGSPRLRIVYEKMMKLNDPESSKKHGGSFENIDDEVIVLDSEDESDPDVVVIE